MGKSSSAKKVARAARAGGRTSAGRQRNLLFPGVIGGIMLVGAALVWYAVDDRQSDASVPPVIGDHWHASYDFYACGEFLEATIPEFENQIGIHTHGDGVIHVHPFSSGGAGEKATLGTFLDETDVELSNDGLTIGTNELGDGPQTWTESDDQCDGEDAEIVVAKWENVQNEGSSPALLTDGLGDIRFRNDGEGYTIAFVPEGETDIPRPRNADQLAQLGAVDDAQPPATDAEGNIIDESTTTTAPGDGGQGGEGGEGGEGGGESPTTTAGDGGGPTTTAPADG